MSHTFMNRRTLMGAGAALAALWTTGARAESNPLGTPPPLTLYGALPVVDHIALSPKGERVAMIVRSGQTQVIFDYNVATGGMNTLPLGPLQVEDLNWVDETYLAITCRQVFTSTRKVDLYQTFVLNPSLKEQPKGLFLKDPILSAWSPSNVLVDGKRQLVYLIADRLMVQDPATQKTRPLRTGLPDYSYLISETGELLAGYDFHLGANEWRLMFPDGKGWKTVRRHKGRTDVPHVAGIAPDGKSVILYLRDGAQPDGYYQVAPDGTLSERLNPDVLNSAPVFHPRTRHLAGFANYDHWVTYDFADPQLKGLAQDIAQTLGDRRFSLEALAEEPGKAIVYTEAKDDFGTYYYVDLTTGTIAPLGETYPELPPAWSAPKTVIAYKAADGLDIDAYLTLPPGRAPTGLPLVVLPHGGPESNDSIGFDYEAQALASRGYAVLQANFRGSTNRDRAFVEKGYGQWGRKMQTDLSDGVRYLAQKGMVDPRRVCIFGSSYGGYASLAGAAFDPGIYRCAVSVSGVSDLPLMMRETLTENGQFRFGSVLHLQKMLGDETQWEAYSPARHADRITIPVLLVHGKDDTVVSIEHSKRMDIALKKAGKPVDFVTLDGEDHWMSREPTRVQTLTTVIAFIEKHNPAYA
ncbi:MAG: S9 family peptidase [Asticcacaulis sp.]